ncbi:MAG TPA: CapA family protein, partial [Thermomicrobiaceae bacterium]|nr:CapA family protein [Thermomicrobiaceae bacterium]
MSTPLTLALAGDVMLGRLVNDVIPARGFGSPWGDLRPVLAAADLFLINLECALTNETRPARDGADQAFHFRA